MRAARVFVVVAAFLATSCGDWIHQGPTNDDIKNSTGLTVETASRIVIDNFNSVWLETPSPPNPPFLQEGPHLGRGGCRTNPNSFMTEGPPWSVNYSAIRKQATPEFTDKAFAKLDALIGRGFVREPSGPHRDGEEDRAYRNDQKYSVIGVKYVEKTYLRGPNGERTVVEEPRFKIISHSPCAAE